MRRRLPLLTSERISYETRLYHRQRMDNWLADPLGAQQADLQQMYQQQQAMAQNLGNYQQALGMGFAAQCQDALQQAATPAEFAEWMAQAETRENWDDYLMMRRGRLRRPADGPYHRELANSRAQEVLEQHLTPEQREDLRTFGWFDVEGKGRIVGRLGFRRTQTRKFRIRLAGPMVDEMKSKGQFQHLCIMALDPLPKADVMLSWKLMIEADLPRFLKTANRIGAPR